MYWGSQPTVEQQSLRRTLKLTQCYSRWVHLHREAGILPKRLNELGAKWQWLDEYDGDIPVEDTAPNPPSSDLSYEEEVLDRILVAPAA